PVPRVGNPWHPSPPGGHSRQETADRHMRMHDVRPLFAKQPHHVTERPPMRQRRYVPLQPWRHPTETPGPHSAQQGTFGTDADDLRPPHPHRTHQRQQEMPQRKIDIGDFDDFEPDPRCAAIRGGKIRVRWGGTRAYPTLLIAHFTCCGPSAYPVSTT